MGIVYRAEHEMLRRPTAIKLLPPGSGRRGEPAALRARGPADGAPDESRTPSRSSTSAARRTASSTTSWSTSTASTSRRSSTSPGPLAPGRVVRILRQVCAALAEAHGIGLIHRDIKPANIILCERGGIPDVAKVLDFGLVKDVSRHSDPGLTNENVLQGTPQYMAPEAIRDSDELGPAQRPLRPRRGRLLPADGHARLLGPQRARDDPPSPADASPSRSSRRLGTRRSARGARGPHPALPRQGPRPAAREREGARQRARGLRRACAVGRGRRAGLVARARAAKNAAKTA